MHAHFLSQGECVHPHPHLPLLLIVVEFRVHCSTLKFTAVHKSVLQYSRLYCCTLYCPVVKQRALHIVGHIVLQYSKVYYNSAGCIAVQQDVVIYRRAYCSRERSNAVEKGAMR